MNMVRTSNVVAGIKWRAMVVAVCSAAALMLSGCGTPTAPDSIAKAFLVERAKENCDRAKLDSLLHPDLAGRVRCLPEADRINDRTTTCKKPDEVPEEDSERVKVSCRFEGTSEGITVTLQRVEGKFKVVG